MCVSVCKCVYVNVCVYVHFETVLILSNKSYTWGESQRNTFLPKLQTGIKFRSFDLGT